MTQYDEEPISTFVNPEEPDENIVFISDKNEDAKLFFYDAIDEHLDHVISCINESPRTRMSKDENHSFNEEKNCSKAKRFSKKRDFKRK